MTGFARPVAICIAGQTAERSWQIVQETHQDLGFTPEEGVASLATDATPQKYGVQGNVGSMFRFESWVGGLPPSPSPRRRSEGVFTVAG